MNTILKYGLTATVGATSFCVVAGEVALFMLSNRNCNLQAILDKFMDVDSEEERAIEQEKLDDLEWIESQDLQHFHMKSDDGLDLHASLLPAKESSKKYVFGIHGYRCYGTKEFGTVAKFYRDLGFNFFMIDHRAHGASEGTYITYGAKESEDCLKWLSFMREEFGEDIQIVIHGISMGAATTMLLLGKELPDIVVFAVSDCGYSSIKEQIEASIGSLHLPGRLGYQLYRVAAKLQADYDPALGETSESLPKCTVPVLFVHGKDDDFVPFSNVYRNYDACAHPGKRLIEVPNCKHAHAFQTGTAMKEAITKMISKYM